MTQIQPLLAKSISRSFRGHRAVQDATLTLDPGALTALVGPSGSGKTTFLRLLAGMERTDQGEIWSGPIQLAGAARHVPIEQRNIGLVFQDFALFPHLTVIQNVAFGLRRHPKADRLTRAEVWLDNLDLSHRRDSYPHHLSGGEQQRTAIARALAPEPVAILLDEPFSGLDPAMRDRARDVALSAVRKAGIPALLVTHDAIEALVHADKIAVIDQGQILQTGAPETIYRHPARLEVARALGPLHALPAAVLPDDWKSRIAPQSDTIWYRPEAIEFGPGIELPVARTKLAGPITEIEFRLSNEHALYAACQPGAPVKAGETLAVTLNPDLVFDFPAQKT